jgi:predicted transposase/invertase (TIGR01784 family)
VGAIYRAHPCAVQTSTGRDKSRPYPAFPKRKKFINEFTLRNEDGEQLSDAVTAVFVELSKLGKIIKKPIDEMSTLEKWAIFLQYADKPKQRELVEKIAESKGEIKMALDTLIHVSQDERERAINRSRRMWQTDFESNMNTSREAGFIEGRNKGRSEGSNERAIIVAKNLLSMGFPIVDIAKATALSPAEIEALQQ